MSGGGDGMSLCLYGDWGYWRPSHCLWKRVYEVGGTFIQFLCPSPSDNGPIGGKVSQLERCEGLCALCGFSVWGCGVCLHLRSKATY